MTPDQLQGLPEYYGLYYDPTTGHSYRSDGSDTGFTFEQAQWTGPFNLHFEWPFLNPFEFATHATALQVLAFGQKFAPQGVALAVDETQKTLGPFTRTIERMITVSDGMRTESYNAGMIANNIIRTGEQAAAISWKAEWRLAGFQIP